MEYLVWWLNQKDTEEAVNTKKLRLPKYIRSELVSRWGRAGRLRLWVSNTLPEPEGIVDGQWIPEEAFKNCKLDSDCGGIVFNAKDYNYVRKFPGVITDLNLKPKSISQTDGSYEQVDAMPPCPQKAIEWGIHGLLTDGGHHKQWIIEQMLVALGVNLKELEKELAQDGYGWEEGIAP